MPATDFLGTTDDQALQFHVNGFRALRLEPTGSNFFDFRPNVINGYFGNSATDGISGATIAGGGSGGSSNTVTEDFGTVGGGEGNSAAKHSVIAGGIFNEATGQFSIVGGGWNNIASGNYSAIPGGEFNRTSGNFGFAAGRRAKAFHRGSFVWADSQNADFRSTKVDQFNIR